MFSFGCCCWCCCFSFFFLTAWDLFCKLVNLCEFVVSAAPGAASSPSPTPPPPSSSLFFYVASSSLAFAQLGIWWWGMGLREWEIERGGFVICVDCVLIFLLWEANQHGDWLNLQEAFGIAKEALRRKLADGGIIVCPKFLPCLTCCRRAWWWSQGGVMMAASSCHSFHDEGDGLMILCEWHSQGSLWLHSLLASCFGLARTATTCLWLSPSMFCRSSATTLIFSLSPHLPIDCSFLDVTVS